MWKVLERQLLYHLSASLFGAGPRNCVWKKMLCSWEPKYYSAIRSSIPSWIWAQIGFGTLKFFHRLPWLNWWTAEHLIANFWSYSTGFWLSQALQLLFSTIPACYLHTCCMHGVMRTLKICNYVLLIFLPHTVMYNRNVARINNFLTGGPTLLCREKGLSVFYETVYERISELSETFLLPVQTVPRITREVSAPWAYLHIYVNTIKHSCQYMELCMHLSDMYLCLWNHTHTRTLLCSNSFPICSHDRKWIQLCAVCVCVRTHVFVCRNPPSLQSYSSSI